MEEDEFWIPLVDEPIGDFVAKLQAEDPELAALVATPRRQLAFRTFAYIRAGLVLGRLLVEYDISPTPGRNWVEELLADPDHQKAVAAEVRAVAREIAADPRFAGDDLSPDPQARQRLRALLDGMSGEKPGK